MNTFQKIYSPEMIWLCVKSYFAKDAYLVSYILHYFKILFLTQYKRDSCWNKRDNQKEKADKDNIEWMV